MTNRGRWDYTEESKPKKISWKISCIFLAGKGVHCVCHSFAYVAHFVNFQIQISTLWCIGSMPKSFLYLFWRARVCRSYSFAYICRPHVTGMSGFEPKRAWRSKVPEVVNCNKRRCDMNGRSQMQGGKNWILPKKTNATRFFWDSHWLEIWKNHLCPSMGPNC